MKFNDEYEIKFSFCCVWLARTTEPNERNEPDEQPQCLNEPYERNEHIMSMQYCARNRCHQEIILRFIFLRWDRKCKTLSSSSFDSDLGIKYRRLLCRRTVKLTLLDVLRNIMYGLIGQTIEEETME